MDSSFQVFPRFARTLHSSKCGMIPGTSTLNERIALSKRAIKSPQISLGYQALHEQRQGLHRRSARRVARAQTEGLSLSKLPGSAMGPHRRHVG